MDDMDIRILKALQKDGRKKHNELARELKVAQSTVMERVRRMEKQGVIRGYRAMVDTRQLGMNVKAFISVRMNRHKAPSIRQFEEGLGRIPSVQACYHLTGRYDYLLHVVVCDLDALGKLVKTELAELPGFGTSETFVIFSEIKPDEGYLVGSDVTVDKKSES